MKKRKYNENNLAIAYYRYSSHSQNDMSIDQQRDAAERYAEAHDLKIVKEYIDRAKSGRTDEREGFQQMLYEVKKIRPSTLIVWKTDRLGRDRYLVADAKKTIRDAGCVIKYIAEAIPDSDEAIIMESLLDGMSEYYSNRLIKNVNRGMRYNARNALYNGHKLLGYSVDEGKHYVEDEKTAPVVRRIFHEYADGKPIVKIAEDLAAQGIRSVHGKKMTVNSLRHILKNRAYIGEYKYDDIIVPDGMPRLVSDELFDTVQKRFEKNKHKARPALHEDDSGRYWLTGKLLCGKCGTTLHGMSGTGKSGKIHYYYVCKNHRKKKCKLKNFKKDYLEGIVINVLRELLRDTELLASLAVDISDYYQKMYNDTKYLDVLKAELHDTEKGLENLVKVIEAGVFSETISNRLMQLEEKKKGLKEAIETEIIKQEIAENQYSIAHFFDKFADADFSDAETRDAIFDYFIEKIYVFDDKLLVTWYYSDDRIEVPLEEVANVAEQGSSLMCLAP